MHGKTRPTVCTCCFGPLTAHPRDQHRRGARRRFCHRCNEQAWDELGEGGPLLADGTCPVHGAPLLGRHGRLPRTIASVAPVYATKEPNVDIVLRHGAAEFTQTMIPSGETATAKGRADLKMSWQPAPGLLSRFVYRGRGWPELHPGKGVLSFLPGGPHLEVDRLPAGLKFSSGFVSEAYGWARSTTHGENRFWSMVAHTVN